VQSLWKIREQIKNEWVTANQAVLELRKKIADAEQEAATIRGALDTMERESPNPQDKPDDNGGQQGKIGITRSRIVALIKERGPLPTTVIASEIGISYPTTWAHLTKGPFRQCGPSLGRGGGRAWEVVEGEG